MIFITNSENSNHKDAICDLLDWAEKCILCTSFLDPKGVKHLSQNIASGIFDRGLDITIISNGEEKYTKRNASKELSLIKGLEHKVTRGKRRLHSKIYYFQRGGEFVAVIGSANITHKGLTENIEFSTKITGTIDSDECKAIQNILTQIKNEC